MLRPDTYIGSIQFDNQQLFVWNEATEEIEHREVRFVPGLYKIFGKFLQ
jgi:DNA topoisomerase-2